MRGLLLAVTLVALNASLAIAQESTAWGKPDKGLRMSLSTDHESRELIFSIQNVSDGTKILNLGENGIPYSLSVNLTTREGKFWNSLRIAMPATGAGVYADIVELLPQSSYVIRHAMKNFTNLGGDWRARVHPLTALQPGDLITGHYARKDEKCLTFDCRGQMLCWTGDLVSNVVSVK